MPATVERPEPADLPAPQEPSGDPLQEPQRQPDRRARLADWIEQHGREPATRRVGTHLLSLLLVLVVIWLMQSLYRQSGLASGTALAAPQTTPTAAVLLADIPVSLTSAPDGIQPDASLYTNIPSRPRLEVETYTVEAGDTVFGIAEKFGLDPETILWGNYYTLRDDPHNLRPGQQLNILPVNGTYYEWQAGDGLNGVADFFGVDPEMIVNFPGNGLDPQTIGDYTHPNIPAGTWLVVPGGRREFVSWSAPVGVTRENPAIAAVLGAGACGAISGGAVGYGSFIWPTERHYLSGNDYSPQSNHRGIDISGYEGAPIYATDSGVIVYAGWNDYGYGYMVMIDHGNGWQSLYAHLSVINVSCGQSVGQGDAIAAMGSTGNSTGAHLHFELMHTEYGKVNPWNLLP